MHEPLRAPELLAALAVPPLLGRVARPDAVEVVDVREVDRARSSSSGRRARPSPRAPASARAARRPSRVPSAAAHHNRSKTTDASGPGSRSGLSTPIAASACSTARAGSCGRHEADQLRVDSAATRGRPGAAASAASKCSVGMPSPLVHTMSPSSANAERAESRESATRPAPGERRAAPASPAASSADASPSARRVASSARRRAVSAGARPRTARRRRPALPAPPPARPPARARPRRLVRPRRRQREVPRPFLVVAATAARRSMEPAACAPDRAEA